MKRRRSAEERCSTQSSLCFYDAMRTSAREGGSDFEWSTGSSVIGLQGTNNETIRLAHLVAVLDLTSADIHHKSEEAVALAAATTMAVYHFNTRSTSVIPNLDELLLSENGNICNLRLTADFYDTHDSPLVGPSVLATEVLPMGETTGVLSGSSLEVTLPMAVVNTAVDTPHLSSSLGSSFLLHDSSVRLHGNLFAPIEYIADVVVEYLHAELGVRFLDILLYETGLDSGRREAFQSATERRSMMTNVVNVNPSTRQGVTDAVMALRDFEYRYIITTATFHDLPALVEEAAKAEVMGPDFFWLIVANISEEDVKSLSTMIDPLYLHATHGLGIVSPRFAEGSQSMQSFLAAWEDFESNEELVPYLSNKTNADEDILINSRPMLEMANMYDSVMSYGISLCQSDGNFPSGEDVFTGFGNITFNGASGVFEFDVDRGTRERFVSNFYGKNVILQDDGSLRSDLSFSYLSCNESTVECSPGWDILRPFNYSGGTYDQPEQLPPLDVQPELVDFTIYVIFCVVAAVVMFCSLIFATWTWRNRTNQVVRASQPIFLIIICIGTFGMAASAAFGGTHVPTSSFALANAACMLSYWLFFLGFALAIGALLAKTWRINKILRQENFRRVEVQPMDVILPGALLFLSNFVIMLAWNTISPLGYEVVLDDEDLSQQDEFGRSVKAYDACIPEEGAVSDFYFILPLFIVNAGAVVAANVQVFRARNITSEFSESRYIAISMVVILQAAVLAVPLFFYPVDVDVRFTGRVLLNLIAAGSILFLIFVPKISFWFKREKILRRREESRRKRLSSLPPGSLSRELFGQESSGESNNVASSSPARSVDPSRFPPISEADDSAPESESENVSSHGADNEADAS